MPERTEANVRYRQILREEVHRAIRPQCCMGESGTYLGCSPAQLPVCEPSSTVANRHREPNGPTSQSRELPTTNNCLGKTMHVPSKPPAFAKRQFSDPVRVELMDGVIIRDSAQCI